MKAPKKKKTFLASCKQQIVDLVEARELARMYNVPFSINIGGKSIRVY